MNEIIQFLKEQFPEAEVFDSCYEDFVCVRHIRGQSKFMTESGQPFFVPIYDNRKYHIDTIRLKYNLK